MKRIANAGMVFSLTAALFIGGVSCDSSQTPPQQAGATCDFCDQPARPAQPAAAKVEIPTTGVRTITLPVIETELPPGRGRLTVMSACTLCHSQRYVMTQPNFPRKTWMAEVDKMKKVYGAPILDEQVEPIVDYLVAIRGNGQ